MKTSTQLKALIRNMSKEKRGTYKRLLETGHENMAAIESSNFLFTLWDKYQKKNPYVSDLSWNEAVASVKVLYNKVFSI